MNPQSRFWAVHKSLYIFLCSLLGILLFFIIHRALSLISMSLVQYDHIYALGLNNLQILGLHIMTMIAALFFGGWYGVWLGLYWHELVYERRHDEMERSRFQQFPVTVVRRVFPNHTMDMKESSPAPAFRQIRKSAPAVRVMPSPEITMPVPKSTAAPVVKPISIAVATKPKAKKKAVRKKAKTKSL